MMTTEELRLQAIALANGDVGNAAAILKFIRPEAEGLVSSLADAFPPAPEVERPFKDREQDWRWSTVRRYAVIRSKDGAIVHVDRRENELSLKGAGNALTWPIVHGPGPYEVYVFDRDTGRSGYVGTAMGCWFVDDNIAPDATRPLPLPVASVSDAGEAPFYGERWQADTAPLPDRPETADGFNVPRPVSGETERSWLWRAFHAIEDAINGVPR